MRYRISHTTKFAYSEPVPVCQNKVHLRPRVTPTQECHEFRLIVIPDPLAIHSQLDYFGNTVDYFSLDDSHRGLSVTAVSLVDVTEAANRGQPGNSPAWDEVARQLAARPPLLDVDTYLYRFDSDYASASATVAAYARPSFAPGRPIVEAGLDLTRRIYEDFEYKPGATNVKTRVASVFSNKAGVCQDFAHLEIACLRSLGLAARYVSGYLRTVPPAGKPRLVGADESHAWLSLFCGERGWVEFDPTNNVIPSTDHVTLAYGRDYGDVCPIQGVFVGGGDQSMTVAVDVLPVEP